MRKVTEVGAGPYHSLTLDLSCIMGKWELVLPSLHTYYLHASDSGSQKTRHPTQRCCNKSYSGAYYNYSDPKEEAGPEPELSPALPHMRDYGSFSYLLSPRLSISLSLSSPNFSPFPSYHCHYALVSEAVFLFSKRRSL